MNLPKNVTSDWKELFIETEKVLKGHQRRIFMARTVNSLGRGGLKFAREQLGWDKNTIWKGQNELRTGIECLDAVNLRGRKSAETRLPNLLADIKEIVGVGHRFDHPMSVIPTKVGIHLSGKHGFPPTRE